MSDEEAPWTDEEKELAAHLAANTFGGLFGPQVSDYRYARLALAWMNLRYDRFFDLIDSLSHVDESTDARLLAARVLAALQGDPNWETVELPDDDIPGGCIYCSSSGVIEDFDGVNQPCSNCDGTGTPRARPTPPTDDVREWRPEDGDTRCQKCGTRNPVWWADNKQWNATVGGPDATDDPGGVLCPSCYHALWLGREVRPHGTVTDAEVGRAVRAYRDARSGYGHMNSDVHFRCMRAALEAARAARS